MPGTTAQEPPEGQEVQFDQEELQEKPDQDKIEEIEKEIAEKGGEPSKEDLNNLSEEVKKRSYHFFVVHESTGKVEIMQDVQPGVVSYAFDPNCVTPRDIRYMLEATYESAGLEDKTGRKLPVKIIMEPRQDFKYATIILDILNRSNIDIGTMELWRYGK